MDSYTERAFGRMKDLSLGRLIQWKAAGDCPVCAADGFMAERVAVLSENRQFVIGTLCPFHFDHDSEQFQKFDPPRTAPENPNILTLATLKPRRKIGKVHDLTATQTIGEQDDELQRAVAIIVESVGAELSETRAWCHFALREQTKEIKRFVGAIALVGCGWMGTAIVLGYYILTR